MNYFLNYLIEANAGLCLFALMYAILLKHETDFRVKRFMVLSGLLASIIFPFIHLSHTAALPTLSDVTPVIWLPEFTINGEGTAIDTPNLWSPWKVIGTVYATGIILFSLLFFIQLIRLGRIITSVPIRDRDGLYIAESKADHQSFSFFRFIYIGNVNTLSQDDKERIISHESVHARQLHSIDILLVNVLGIFFWFNPVLRYYRKIFVQLHEFEADARAVKSHEVNEYCNLLARVALMSADISMANYFNNSLTVKRIEMMRKIKMKLKRWKIAALIGTVVSFFFMVACQDQVSEIADIAESGMIATDIPSL